MNHYPLRGSAVANTVQLYLSSSSCNRICICMYVFICVYVYMHIYVCLYQCLSVDTIYEIKEKHTTFSDISFPQCQRRVNVSLPNDIMEKTELKLEWCYMCVTRHYLIFKLWDFVVFAPEITHTFRTMYTYAVKCFVMINLPNEWLLIFFMYWTLTRVASDIGVCHLHI